MCDCSEKDYCELKNYDAQQKEKLEKWLKEINFNEEEIDGNKVNKKSD